MHRITETEVTRWKGNPFLAVPLYHGKYIERFSNEPDFTKAEADETRFFADVLSLLIIEVPEPGVFHTVNVPDFTSKHRIGVEEFFWVIKNLHCQAEIDAKDPHREWIATPGNLTVLIRIPEKYYTPREVGVSCISRKSFTRRERRDIHEFFGNECVYCGADSEHVDHVVPVSRGGTNHWTNLVASCKSCNIRKGDRFLSEIGWGITYRYY